MQDYLQQIIRDLAEKADRRPGQQILYLIKLGLKSKATSINKKVSIPENWQIIEGGK